MHRLKEILRQKLVLKRSHRQVAQALGVSLGLVHRATALGAEQIDALGEDELA